MLSSEIILSEKALKNNIEFIRKQLNPGVKLSCVLKGNAYGHGIHVMIPQLEKLGVDHFSIFSSFEAKEAKKYCSNNSTLMIMGHLGNEHVSWVVENEIEIYVFNISRLKLLEDEAIRQKKAAKIHIEVETGMNRTGFVSDEWEGLIKTLSNNSNFEVIGVCTHFAGAESIANYTRIQEQRKVFDRFKSMIDQSEVSPQQFHTSCSAALMGYPKEQRDLVRIGILMYGFWPSKEILVSYLTKAATEISPLQRVISWKSTVMSIKKINKREFVGYGMSFLSEIDMKMATVPVGYSSGYCRDLSNRGKVIIHGKRLDVIGIINMNLLMVDVTSVSDLKEGDEVILIGESNLLEISVASFSEVTNQLNYEVLTQLDKDISRKFI